MKRTILLAMVATAPMLFFFNAWQTFKYETVRNQVLALEQQQQDWLEKNKKMIIGIEVLSSPARLDSIVSKEPGFVNNPDAPTLHIEIKPEAGGSNG